MLKTAEPVWRIKNYIYPKKSVSNAESLFVGVENGLAAGKKSRIAQSVVAESPNGAIAMRNLCVILGDQLDRKSRLFEKLDPARDRLWMAEVTEESTHVWSHKQRIVLFLSAMRHFAQALKTADIPLDYWHLQDHQCDSLAEVLSKSLQTHKPEKVRVVRPGDYRVLEALRQVCDRQNIPLEILQDQHFLSTPAEFAQWAKERKQLRMEYWYRKLRQRYQILLEDDGKPAGGKWNYDQANRKSFGKTAPDNVPAPLIFAPDELTHQVIQLVQERFANHPGNLERFNWPVTPEQAENTLEHFIQHSLPHFGDYQDAMWTDEPFLFHSLLSAAINLKLIHPLKVIEKAVKSYKQGLAPLNAVEGFVRQILGWREYVRGLYWLHMPAWQDFNALQAEADLPAFYWTAETDMQCLQQSIQQTLDYGYAHHIQRLMVTGLFSLLYGVEPKQIHAWYLAVYVDAVEWVELPNTIGMSQYADGGLMASKPYAASGNYINKMSNYCKQCVYKPSLAVGNNACPMTFLFWDFLERHQQRFETNPRMGFMLKNLHRKTADEREQIHQNVLQFRQQLESSKVDNGIK
ncbi:MAG: deoxyribodipyrimidine photolyase-related protein [uncultured Thiotrichaceae bacterium]|uniref:Deoxyribodipyrimidine photolyase-related protein n=1 Tax=uncultured Thiotrichaceae bacterium TaxID=298394 RepID=A0A6S6TXU6_9GAMM|nr:MAG: deoxyribodipyrimidine photolyase-related protein [uncultured Thiotrichaceae bacterium]